MSFRAERVLKAGLGGLWCADRSDGRTEVGGKEGGLVVRVIEQSLLCCTELFNRTYNLHW